MKKLVGVLFFVTLIFAGATAYLANELRVETQRAHASLAPMHPRATTTPLDVTSSPSLAEGRSGSSHAPLAGAVETAATDSVSQPGALAASSGRDARRLERIRARQAEMGARMLAQYEDPVGRQNWLADARDAARENLGEFPRLAGLTEAEVNRLVELLAQEQVESSVTVARCRVDPACAAPARALALLDARGAIAQVAEVLGPEKAERYRRYLSSLEERRGVTSFRVRLADDQMLSDADAERLIEALAQERQKYLGELEQVGDKAGMFAAGGSAPVYYRLDVVPPGETRQLSRETDAAVAFSERMKKTASQILNTDQLRVFGEMQEDVLTLLRERNREDQMEFPSAAGTDSGARPVRK